MAQHLRLRLRALDVARTLGTSHALTLPVLTSASAPAPSRSIIPHHHRTIIMSTAPAPPRKAEWLVIVPDKPGTLAKRLEVRPQHFAGLKPLQESSRASMAGAILEDVPVDDDPASLRFCGSTLILEAATSHEILDTLRGDVYATSGVWDLEKVQMWPLKLAFRKAM